MVRCLDLVPTRFLKPSRSGRDENDAIVSSAPPQSLLHHFHLSVYRSHPTKNQAVKLEMATCSVRISMSHEKNCCNIAALPEYSIGTTFVQICLHQVEGNCPHLRTSLVRVHIGRDEDARG